MMRVSDPVERLDHTREGHLAGAFEVQEIPVEIEGGYRCRRTRIDADDEITRLAEERAEPDPIKPLPVNPDLDVGTPVCGDRDLVPRRLDRERDPAAPTERTGLSLLVLHPGSEECHLDLASLLEDRPMDLPAIPVLAPPALSWRSVPAHHDLALVLECDDFGAGPKRGDPRNSPGLVEGIEPVETDVVPAGDFPECLFLLAPGHLDEVDRRREHLEKREDVVGICRHFLQAVNSEDIRLLLGEPTEETEPRYLRLLRDLVPGDNDESVPRAPRARPDRSCDHVDPKDLHLFTRAIHSVLSASIPYLRLK